jgi:carbon-monoxide dehydrogenase small subunit
METSTSVEIAVRINGTPMQATVPVRRLLVDVLRDDCGLTGTHIGCEQGVCGACTVLVDGEPVRSCIQLAAQVDGSEITTVEGLVDEHAVAMRDAFRDCHALQCGYCTPGILVTLAAADRPEHPDDASVRELLAGNLCRCTGYQHIVDAVLTAWAEPPSTAPSRNEDRP